jgi:hypothetical protein
MKIRATPFAGTCKPRGTLVPLQKEISGWLHPGKRTEKTMVGGTTDFTLTDATLRSSPPNFSQTRASLKFDMDIILKPITAIPDPQIILLPHLRRRSSLEL